MNAVPGTSRAVSPKSENQSQVTCAHCELPVPKGLIDDDGDKQFCCSGCRAAFQLIHENGLAAFYQMAESPTESGQRIRSSTERFDEFDRDEFQSRFGCVVEGPMREMLLALDGIHCAACIWLLEKLPQIVPGVEFATVRWARKTIKVRWNSDSVKLSKIGLTLHQLGYTPHPVLAGRSEKLRQLENRKHLSRIGVAAAAAGNNMLIAAAIYLGWFSYMSPGFSQMLRVASCIVGMVALLWPGRVFLRGAISSIRTRTPHMDLPIALALVIGTLVGLVNTIKGSGEIYFDSLSVLIFLLLIGRWIQFRQQNRAMTAVEALHRLTPGRARKIVDGRVVETFVDLLKPGDVIEVRSDEVVPVDGVLMGETSSFDESILSGESKPLSKCSGDEVFAGARNCGALSRIETTGTGAETRLSKIVELVESASSSKTETVQWANQIGGYFVVAVVSLATLTFAFWAQNDINVAVDRAVALLIIACPCALAIATPLTIAAAMGRAARRKIVVKTGDVIQSLNRPGMIWLDKTGTLTEGELEVNGWTGDSQVFPYVLAIESQASHPIAKAVSRFVENELGEASNLKQVSGFENFPAQGVCGMVDGHRVAVGNRKLIERLEIGLGEWNQNLEMQFDQRTSPCFVAFDDEVVGVFSVGDQVRNNALDVIEQLRVNGWDVGILSGDHERIVESVADELAILPELAFGELSPEAKLAAVQDSLGSYETVVMVGDGVNDCAALAAASVGIAVHGGAEASLESAPVYFADSGLEPLVELLAVAKSTKRSLRANFCVSIAYNLTAATLAFLGFINPLVAAILMPINSVVAVAIALPAGTTSYRRNKS